MNENLEKIIFPKNNRRENTNFYYDDVGLYSISIVKDAKATTQFIVLELHKRNINPKKLTIMEGTGGLGGNAISFCFAFKEVLIYEIDKDRFDMLNKNINNYIFSNYKLYHKSCLDDLETNISDLYFFDPPWGGPEYKNEKNIRLKLGNISLLEITKKINKINDKSFIIFKLPYNYDLSEFNEYTLTTIEIRNCIILLIFP